MGDSSPTMNQIQPALTVKGKDALTQMYLKVSMQRYVQRAKVMETSKLSLQRMNRKLKSRGN